MSFFGIDPTGLKSLGSDLEIRADWISTAAERAVPALERNGRGGAADRVGTRLTSLAHTLRTYSADFGWRIDAVERADTAPAFGLAPGFMPIRRLDLAVALPVGTPFDPIRIIRTEVHRLSEQVPQEVAAYLATRSTAEIGVMAAAYPELFTRLDGAPSWARYAASDLLIGRRIRQLRNEAAEIEMRLGEEQPWFQKKLFRDHLELIGDEVAELQRWLAEDRQILLFDPAGDGRVIEVFGDLESAVNIGVVVPGITNDRSNFSDESGGFRIDAKNIHDRSVQLNIGGVATVAWLGYDTPDGVDAVLRRAATAGHGDLIDFVAGLDALEGRRHIAVIGHSYGSLLTGMAARAGLAANEVVFVGSPGTSLNHANEAQLKPGGVVWAGLASGDPIGAGVDITEYLTPQDQLKQTVRRILDSLGGESAVKDLHHGTNPAHEDFGAIEIQTDGSTGHSEYFKPDTVTLDNLLYIIAGMDGRVAIENPNEIELAPGPIGEPWGRTSEVA